MQGLVNFGKNVGKFKKKEKINSALTRRARCCRGGSRHERKGEWKQKGSEKRKRKWGLRKNMQRKRKEKAYESNDKRET